jgi:hypothetical protein
VSGLAIFLLALLVALALGIAFVLYRELRNQRHIWHDPCVTPEDVRADIRYVLHALGEALEGKQVTWWLDYGTLLGAWRLGDVMAFDHDLDLSCLANDRAALEACAPALEARGIVIDLTRTSLFYRGRKIGDMEMWTRYGRRLCRDDPARRSGVMKYWRPLVDDFPARWIEPLARIRFDGAMYPCPNQPLRFIRHRYLTCRIHPRLVIPHKQKCWLDRAFWIEAARILAFRDAPFFAGDEIK